MRNGIDIKDGNSVLATVSSAGTGKELDKYKRKIISEYSYGRENDKYNAIIAVPTEIDNGDKSMYLGFPDINTDTAGNQYKTTCVLDYLCCQEQGKGKIPKEFVLGYYISTNEENTLEQSTDKTVEFIENANHYSLLSEDEKKRVFDELASRINGKYKEISDAVIAKDLEKLNILYQQEEEDNLKKVNAKKIELLENGIANKRLAETLAESKFNTAAKQAKTYLNEKTFELQKEQTVAKKRRIPLELLRNDNANTFMNGLQQYVNTSEEIEENDINDLVDAKSITKETTEKELGF